MGDIREKLLICDLDNTLYDWVTYFVASFYAMVDVAVDILGCQRENLLDDLRFVHRKHNDSEHPFALLDTNIVTSLFKGKSRREMAEILDPAFHAFNKTRKETLSLFSGVEESLQLFLTLGMKLVAHTESKLYAVVDRLRRLDIEKYFSSIYCRQRSTAKHPYPELASLFLNDFPLYKVNELNHDQVKPDPKVLLEICKNEGYKPHQVVYVGDSVARDMLMAKKAGVYAIWAKYGSKINSRDYNRLVRITHWTEEDVKREKQLRQEASKIIPDFTASTSFYEVIAALGLSENTF